MTPVIFCPSCSELVLDQASCASCGWTRPAIAAGAPRWSAALGAAPAAGCLPAIAPGRYCVPADELVLALDLATGAAAWRFRLPAGQSAVDLAVCERLVLVAAEDRRPIPQARQALVALDSADGRVVWRYQTGGHSLSAPAVHAGVIYVSSVDGQLHAVDAGTGQARWVGKHPQWGPAAPAAAAGLLYVGGQGDKLYTYDLQSGAPRWAFQGGGWFAGRPQIVAGRVIAQCWDQNLYVLDAADGALVWKRRGERGRGYTSLPVANSSSVYIGDRVQSSKGPGGYALLALDAATGAERWRYGTASRVPVSPYADDTLLVLVAQDGGGYALDPAGGGERWRFSLPAAPTTTWCCWPIKMGPFTRCRPSHLSPPR